MAIKNYWTYIEPGNVFRRVFVDDIVINHYKVRWELQPRFHKKPPLIFTVQFNQNFNDPDLWLDVVTVVDEYSAEFDAPLITGRIIRSGIRIKLVDSENNEYYSFPIPGFGKLTERQWNYIRTITRRYSLIPRNNVFLRGALLKRKWFGPDCQCRHDFTREITDTYCKVCYGTGKAGGYWKAWEGRLIDISPKMMITKRDPHMTRGVVDAQVVSAILPSVVPVDTEDVWVNYDNNIRYFVRLVRNRAEINGIPVLQQLELGPAEFTQVIYEYPVTA